MKYTISNLIFKKMNKYELRFKDQEIESTY